VGPPFGSVSAAMADEGIAPLVEKPKGSVCLPG
jgi:hypothetical protein